MLFLISSVLAQLPQSVGSTPIDKTGCMVDNVPTLQCFEVLFENVLKLASGLIVLVLFLMFVWGSFMYLTSAGDAEKVAKAKSTFTWAIIGTVLFMGSYLILMIIQVLFLKEGFSLFEFKIPEP